MKKGGLKTETVEAKLRELNGNLAAVGRSFGVTRQAVWKFIQDKPALVAAADDVREGMKDNAESALQKAVLNGEAWAVCFYLKTQAKDRGYVEQHSIELLLRKLAGTVSEMNDGDLLGILRSGSTDPAEIGAGRGQAAGIDHPAANGRAP